MYLPNPQHEQEVTQGKFFKQGLTGFNLELDWLARKLLYKSGLMDNEQDGGFEIVSSISSEAIAFTFGLIPLETV